MVENARSLGKQMILSDFPVYLEQDLPNSVFFDRNSPQSLASLLAAWWESLSPGPDLEKEGMVKNESVKAVQAFAYRFLEIARSSFSEI